MGIGKKAIVLLLAVLLVSGIAAAQAIKAPSKVEITQQGKSFQVTLYNDSETSQLVSLSLLSPIAFKVEPTPLSIPASSSQKFTITLLPEKSQSNQTLKATILAGIGNFDEKKEIEISIGDFSSAAGTTGFFVLPSLAEISAEQAIDAVLVIIIIVLAIALIARIINRSKKKEFQ